MVLLAFAPLANADYIGQDNFDYADSGSIAGKNGGTGWEIDGQKAAWRFASGNATLINKKLVLGGSGGQVFRKFGESGSSNAAVQGKGKMFFAVDISMKSNANEWAGISSYDGSHLTTERVFFGVTSGQFRISMPADPQGGFGSQQASVSGLSVEANKTYRIVGLIDWDNDKLKMWVNPDKNDTEDTQDAMLNYSPGNWSFGIRLGAGSSVDFDNVNVATTFTEAAGVPEPATLGLLMLGATGLLSRRNRSAKVSRAARHARNHFKI